MLKPWGLKRPSAPAAGCSAAASNAAIQGSPGWRPVVLNAYATMHSACGPQCGSTDAACAWKSCCMSGLSWYLSLARPHSTMASSCGLKAASCALHATTYAPIQPADGCTLQRASAHSSDARPWQLKLGRQPSASAARPSSRSRSRTSSRPSACAMLAMARGWPAMSAIMPCSSAVSSGTSWLLIRRALYCRPPSCCASFTVRENAADRWMALRRWWCWCSRPSRSLHDVQWLMATVSSVWLPGPLGRVGQSQDMGCWAAGVAWWGWGGAGVAGVAGWGGVCCVPPPGLALPPRPLLPLLLAPPRPAAASSTAVWALPGPGDAVDALCRRPSSCTACWSVAAAACVREGARQCGRNGVPGAGGRWAHGMKGAHAPLHGPAGAAGAAAWLQAQPCRCCCCWCSCCPCPAAAASTWRRGRALARKRGAGPRTRTAACQRVRRCPPGMAHGWQAQQCMCTALYASVGTGCETIVCARLAQALRRDATHAALGSARLLGRLGGNARLWSLATVHRVLVHRGPAFCACLSRPMCKLGNRCNARKHRPRAHAAHTSTQNCWSSALAALDPLRSAV